MAERVLTHHVNVRNPRSGDVQTFAPGAELPKWAAEALAGENHPAYPEDSAEARRAVRRFQASATLAEED